MAFPIHLAASAALLAWTGAAAAAPGAHAPAFAAHSAPAARWAPAAPHGGRPAPVADRPLARRLADEPRRDGREASDNRRRWFAARSGLLGGYGGYYGAPTGAYPAASGYPDPQSDPPPPVWADYAPPARAADRCGGPKIIELARVADRPLPRVVYGAPSLCGGG